MVIIEQPIVLDLLDTTGTPALSSTSDMPVVETKPDASNEGAPPEVPAASEEDKTQAESATAPEEPPASDEPKKAKGVQKRLDELTKQREDERRRAEAAEARLDRALAALEHAGGKPAEAAKADMEATDPEPVKPSRTDYQEAEAYEQSLLDYAKEFASWTARKEVRAAQVEAEQKMQAETIEQTQRAAREAYSKRVETTKTKYADFTEIAESPDVQVSIPMAAAILHSENGPELQYYLGKNPQEAQRIRDLSPPLQLMELGKIEAKLTAPPQPKSVSAAPAPIKPISGASAAMSKSVDDMSMEEYAAYRKQQSRDQRVRH